MRDQAAEDRVRAQAQLDRLNKLAEQTKADREERERLLASLDDLRFVMEAFGRDGVPALIVETVAVPVIETRANEILAAFGIACRLELRTQRESQAGTLSEALDIVLIWEDGAEQEFQFFSGGERSRIDRALRLGFAELLVRHGGSDLLVVDEPEYLDAAAAAALIEILRAVSEKVSQVVLISHDPTLRDSFDQTVEIVRENGRSRIVGSDVEAKAAQEKKAGAKA